MSSRKEIVVVSGLPRSGTSMMMQMLKAGGCDICTDNVRAADEHNPWGYYEFEPVKRLYYDNSWLKDVIGVIKIISHLLIYLPDRYDYKIIFMLRDIEDVTRSQNKMLDTIEKISGRLVDCFSEHLESLQVWLANQSNMDVKYFRYKLIKEHPATNCVILNEYMDNKLDVRAMLDVIKD